MKDRIKKIRKYYHLTQSDFGARIGIKGNTVTNYELGLRNPSDAIIHSLCREFNVSEDWLRYGKGDMFRQKTRSEAISSFAESLMQEEDESFKKRLVESLSELNEKEWELLEKVANKLVKKE